MTILGIDPGSINCGYGVLKQVDKQKNNCKGHSVKEKDFQGKSGEYIYLTSGRIAASSNKPLYLRMKEIFVSLTEIIEEYKPDEIVVEKIFFAKSTRIAFSMGYTRGAIILTAALKDIPIYEYTALQVKKAVVGYGMAEKKQVQEMVKRILNINRQLSFDSADALALAICHINNKKFINLSQIIKKG